MSDPRQITFICADPPLTMVCWADADPALLTGGIGGWQTVQRPRRKSLTQWQGNDPLQQDVPVMIDNFILDIPIDTQMQALERMGRDPNGGEPPIIRVVGPIIHAELDWVINDITWGVVARNRTGSLVRQAAVVHLLEYVADDRLTGMPAAEQARRKALQARAAATRAAGGPTAVSPHGSLYVVAAGDTLSGIAAKQLGSYKRWTEIAQLNNIRDPNNIKVGQKLRLP